MKTFSPKIKCSSALLILGLLAAAPAIADKPSWPGAGKGERMDRSDEHKGERRDHGQKSRRDKAGPSHEKRGHFEDGHRELVREYYSEQFRGGRCPPGLRKKNNGCLPPGQAKKWQRGQPLPREVIFHTVPQPLVVKIGLPPSGYRYVRVATDILLIAVGTGMVMDAIEDLGR